MRQRLFRTFVWGYPFLGTSYPLPDLESRVHLVFLNTSETAWVATKDYINCPRAGSFRHSLLAIVADRLEPCLLDSNILLLTRSRRYALLLHATVSLAHQMSIHHISTISQIHARLRATYKSGVTRPLAYRRKQLLQLARLMQENVTAFEDAELHDLGKPRMEVALIELTTVVQACLYAAKNLEEWAKPEKPVVEEWRSSWDTTIYHVPKGVALIIA